jgi:hypothetical protein
MGIACLAIIIATPIILRPLLIFIQKPDRYR